MIVSAKVNRNGIIKWTFDVSERKMSLLWRDRNVQTEGNQKMGNRRVKRGGGGWMDYGDGGHGGMDFPSAEAALLTISFLTFAVFLIKLVLVRLIRIIF